MIDLKILLLSFLFPLVGITGLLGQNKIHLTQGRSAASIEVPTVQEAGGNLTSSVETSNSYVRLNITTRNTYKITIRRQDINWNSNLDFFVRRTGNGNGNGTITGGTNYVLLNTFTQDFFTGYLSRTSVPMQYKVSGMDITMPSGEYSTYVVYTITSN